MRILISAYACEPGKGSEPEVGLQIALAAASQHEVWVITRKNNLSSNEAFLHDHPLRDRVHIVGLDVDGLANRFKKRGGSITLHWYYDMWQRRLEEVAVRLDQEFDFDVLHHATFSSYWTRVGIAAVDKPLIWGPVGGGVRSPVRLLPVMGFKGALADLVRLSFRPILARMSGYRATARRASVILAQNPETGSVLQSSNKVMVLPNALLGARAIDSDGTDPGRRANLVTASRLVGWKGTGLVISAVPHLRDPTTSLDVFGDGKRLRQLNDLATRLGVASRIRFHGHISRSRLIEETSKAGVFVHPSLHEEGGLVVAEALALGTPVVCLNLGGPPVVAKYWPRVPSRCVSPSNPNETVRALALAIDEVIGLQGPVDSSPADLFRDELMRAYAQAAAKQTL